MGALHMLGPKPPLPSRLHGRLAIKPLAVHEANSRVTDMQVSECGVILRLSTEKRTSTCEHWEDSAGLMSDVEAKPSRQIN
jgi:hypothetical protein